MVSDCAEAELFLDGEDKSRSTGLGSSCAQVKSDDGLGPRWKFWRRRRDSLCILSFFGFVNVAFLRTNLNMAIVAMTSNHPVLLPNGTTVEVKDFNWDPLSKGVLLSAFFYGYIVSQIPGGWMAYRFGGHRIYGLGVSITAFLTLISPTAAEVHIYLLVALRITEGLCEGLSFPSMEFMIAKWSPVLERNRFGSVAFSGMPIGNVVSMILSGYLASNFGWKWVFYVSGFLAAVWASFWWVLASEDPLTDSRITTAESIHIVATRAHNFKLTRDREAVPWLKILSSVPVCSAFFAAFVAAWSFHGMLTLTPTFVKVMLLTLQTTTALAIVHTGEIMGFDLKKTGFVSATSPILSAIFGPLHGYIVDIVLTRKLLSITVVRKMSICGSLVVNSILLACLGYFTSAPVIVTCLVVSTVINGITAVNVNLNYLDMAPQYSSVTMGISHTLSGLAGAISPTLSGYIVRNNTVAEWQTVFGISGGLTVLGALVYGILGSGKLQAWANNDDPSQRRPQPKGLTDHRLRVV